MVDPIHKLPSETIEQIFSSLNTAALTRSEGVSKSWASELQNPFLHLIDLTKPSNPKCLPFKRYGETELIDLVHRLSRKYGHSVKALHLDLVCFWNRFCSAVQVDEEEGTFFLVESTINNILTDEYSKICTLFTVIRLVMDTSLEKLFLVVSGEDADFSPEHVTSFAQVIIKGSFDLLKSMPKLNELHLTLPFPFSLSAGGLKQKDGSTSKKIVIIGDLGEDEPLWMAGDCEKAIEVLRLVHGFGAKLTAVDLRTENFLDTADEEIQSQRASAFRRLVQNIKQDCLKLNPLKLNFFVNSASGSLSLDLISLCSNLTSLTLSLRGRDLLGFPRGKASSRLKHLTLGVSKETHLDVSSENFGRWIGNNLESLSLDRVKISDALFSSIMSSNTFIRRVTLVSVEVFNRNSSPTPNIISSLPTPSMISSLHLEFLQINHGNSILAYADAVLPKLQDLRIEITPKEHHEDEDSTKAPVCFFNLASTCKSSLSKLTFAHTDPINFDIAFPEVKSFSKVESLELRLSGGSKNMFQFFTKNKFPSLKSIQLQSEPDSISAVVALLNSTSSSLTHLILAPGKESIISPSTKDLVVEFVSFPNLKHLWLGKTSTPLLEFFSQSGLPNLQNMEVVLIHEYCAKMELDSKQLMASLFSILDSSKLSLVDFKLFQHTEEDELLYIYDGEPENVDELSTFYAGDRDYFEGNVSTIEEQPSMTFLHLEVLRVRSKALLKFFDKCYCPKLKSGEKVQIQGE